MREWHKREVSEVALEFGTDVNNGKIHQRRERKRRGDNNVFLLPAVDSKSEIKKLISDASVVLLATVYVLSAFLGHFYDSFAGLVLLCIVFGISFAVKKASLKRVANSYRLLLPGAKVIEGGVRHRLSVFDVEAGDLIEFSQGDIIPADARIVSSDNLIVAERYSDQISGKIAYRIENKFSDVLINAEDDAGTYSNIVYAASMVVSGRGRAIVTETGSDTRLAGQKSEVRIISENDTPEYFQAFYTKAKRLSLAIFLAVIPITLLSLIRKSPMLPDSENFDLLYSFLLFLAVSVTCMSELIISPAESLVTKELLISSRKGKALNNTESRITKLSSAETIADTDTVMILSREVLVDSRNFARRVFFSDKSFRFDSLKSEDLSAFYDLIAPILVRSGKDKLSPEMNSLKDFLKDNDLIKSEVINNQKSVAFLRNYPIDGARACVVESDEAGKPINSVFYTKSISLVNKCAEFRTEGGGLWKTDSHILERIYSEFNKFENVGLSTVIFMTLNRNHLIFEGMIGFGKEFPFADGTLSEEYSVSGIQPVIFIENENQDNMTVINECGFVQGESDIAVASEYMRNGMDITDAPITTRAYIGFDRKEVGKLTDRLIRNGRKILPVIKDSADRRGIVPLSVYAVHSVESFDSVKISASLTIQPSDADARKGGVHDILKMIRGASMARLKLGVYKNYLAFSVFLRTVAVCCSLLFGKSGSYITSLMILSMGFVCDAIAVIALTMSKGIPFKPQKAVSDAKVLFSPTLFLFFAIAGVVSGVAIFAVTEILLAWGKLHMLNSAIFLTYAVVLAQVVSLGGFLMILNKQSRQRMLNWSYLSILFVLHALLIIQYYMPDDCYCLLSKFNMSRIELHLLPFMLLVSLVAFIAVALIGKLLSSFSESNIN